MMSPCRASTKTCRYLMKMRSSRVANPHAKLTLDFWMKKLQQSASHTRICENDMAAAATMSAREDARKVLLLLPFLPQPQARHHFQRMLQNSLQVADESCAAAADTGIDDDISRESSSVKYPASAACRHRKTQRVATEQAERTIIL